MRFTTIARENNTKYLIDLETLTEYPLNIETLMNIANRLNDEILDYEEILIKLGEGFKETIEKQEGLLLGNVPHTALDTVVTVMNLESNNHKKSNADLLEYSAFQKVKE